LDWLGGAEIRSGSPGKACMAVRLSVTTARTRADPGSTARSAMKGFPALSILVRMPIATGCDTAAAHGAGR